MNQFPFIYFDLNKQDTESNKENTIAYRNAIDFITNEMRILNRIAERKTIMNIMNNHHKYRFKEMQLRQIDRYNVVSH